MRKVVSFSGGRTSAYLCKVMIDTFGRENVDFIFMDTGAEHPKTYDFIRKVNNEFNLELTCIKTIFNPLGKGNDFTFVDVNSLKNDLGVYSGLIKKYGVPELGMGCTKDLKERIYTKYCGGKYGKGNFESWLGIRIDEPKRLKESTRSIMYLADISDFEKQDVLNWWSKMKFDLEIDEWLGNCVFCPKKSNLKLAAAKHDEPGLYYEWLSMLHSDSVRVDDNTSHWSKMYRGKQSLESLIATFDGSTGKEIKARIRGGKMIDTNSCSESCEVFS